MSDRHREGWVDLAKGTCIALVVVWHVATKHVQHLDWGAAQPVAAMWGTFSAQLLPLRMPVFFLISGMLAWRAVYAPSAHRLVRRALGLVILYCLWLLIQTVVLAAAAPDFETARAHSLGELLGQLTFSPTNLWYLQALALYLLITRFTRCLPRWVLLTLAFIVSSLAALSVLPSWENSWQVTQNAFFFLLGVHGRDWIRAITSRTRVPAALLACLVFAAATLVTRSLDLAGVPGVWPVLCLLAIAAGVLLSVVADDRATRVTAPLRQLGQRTLPVYVLHMMPLAIADRLIGDHPAVTRLPGAAMWEPLLLTIAVIAVSLGLHSLLRRCGLGALFDPLRRAAA